MLNGLDKILYATLIIISLSLIPGADAWQNQTITVSIEDNQYATEQKIKYIKYAISSTTQSDGRFSGWNAALNTINGTMPNFEMIDDNADVVIKLVKYSSNMYAGFTSFESNSTGIRNGATVTIYDIEDISNSDLLKITRHELGHVLGLNHSQNRDDLMYPIIPYYTSFISPANIQDVKNLYK